MLRSRTFGILKIMASAYWEVRVFWEPAFEASNGRYIKYIKLSMRSWGMGKHGYSGRAEILSARLEGHDLFVEEL